MNKSHGKFTEVKKFGVAKSEAEADKLFQEAQLWLRTHDGQQGLDFDDRLGKELEETARSEKNRYIEEEKEVLATHRTKILKMLEEHEKKTRNIIRQDEGIWLSDFWMKIFVGSIYSVIGLLALALWLK